MQLVLLRPNLGLRLGVGDEAARVRRRVREEVADGLLFFLGHADLVHGRRGERRERHRRGLDGRALRVPLRGHRQG